MGGYKLKAFTILEVTIAMLITGSLIAITYTSYSIIVKSYRSFESKNVDMAVLVNLDHLLKRDFEQAETIYKTQDGVSVKKAGSFINYEFKPDYVVRVAARIDTFKVQTEDLNVSFENLPLLDVQETEEQNRIDRLGFTLLYKGEQIPYLYHKLYSSVNLIQRNSNALN